MSNWYKKLFEIDNPQSVSTFLGRCKKETLVVSIQSKLNTKFGTPITIFWPTNKHLLK